AEEEGPQAVSRHSARQEKRDPAQRAADAERGHDARRRRSPRRDGSGVVRVPALVHLPPAGPREGLPAEDRPRAGEDQGGELRHLRAVRRADLHQAVGGASRDDALYPLQGRSRTDREGVRLGRNPRRVPCLPRWAPTAKPSPPDAIGRNPRRVPCLPRWAPTAKPSPPDAIGRNPRRVPCLPRWARAAKPSPPDAIRLLALGALIVLTAGSVGCVGPLAMNFSSASLGTSG